MSGKMVRVQEVTKQYSSGKFALREVSFDLYRGEFAFITGMNGAGKTTLLKLLFGIESASTGSIQVNSREVTRLTKKDLMQYRREVGFVFQDFRLLPDISIEENVALPLEIRKMTRSELEYRVHGVLTLVGLADRAKDFPTSLSGGEQQRIAIARSIVTKPVLLLADEPTGNLDSRTAREILALFQEIQEMGTTVLFATHDESLMADFPSRIIELEKGSLIADRVGEA